MRVARKVLENTKHTLLVGDKATEFAISLGNFTIYLGMELVMGVTSEVVDNTKHKTPCGNKSISLGNFVITSYMN